MTDKDIVRFWSKVNRKSDKECWEWTSSQSDDGYGRLWLDGRYERAHRVSYEQLVGEIPIGKQLDHLCRNILCVNPKHLEIVDLKTNVLRGTGITAENARKTHCKNGHELSEENIYKRPKGRECRECKRKARVVSAL